MMYGYDVDPQGRGVAIVRRNPDEPDAVVVPNWLEEVKDLLAE